MNISRAAAGRCAVVGLVLLAGTGLAAVPAYASGISVGAACDSGSSEFECDAVTTGGAGSLTYSWAKLENPFGGDLGNGDSAFGDCAPNANYSLALTVRDATGATAHATVGGFCRSTPWS